jgi:hypothetical protein
LALSAKIDSKPHEFIDFPSFETDTGMAFIDNVVKRTEQ